VSSWTREKLLTKVREVSVWKRGDQRAPHKPLLILNALGKLLVGQNQVLFKDFYEPFEKLLREFGPPRRSYHPEFPFWYLRSEGFWEIEPATGWIMRKGASSPSKAELIGREAIGRFVPAVQELLLNDPVLADEVVSVVLNNHFPDSIHEDILEAVGLEPLQIVKPKRDPRFRDEVLRTYGYRCAICGFDLRLDNIPLAVDAAHIRWHQARGPSTVSNGIALCSLHHKLFDRGAFSLSETFRIEISARVNGSAGLVEHLGRFGSGPIAVPNMRGARPDLVFIRWHRAEVFHPPVADLISDQSTSIAPSALTRRPH
jgi:putative restriction endonuclease